MVRRHAQNVARYFGAAEEANAATTSAHALRSLAVMVVVLVLGSLVAGALGTHGFLLQLLEAAATGALIGVLIRGYAWVRACGRARRH